MTEDIPLLVNYFQHNAIYLLKKEAKANGWQTLGSDLEIIGWLEHLFGVAKVDKGKLLELGCGAGNISIFLAMKGFDITGVDISPVAISWAKERAKSLRMKLGFLVGDVTDLRFMKERSFDVIVDSLCLHCLIGSDRKKYLYEVSRLLRPEGAFFLMTMCDNPKPRMLKEKFDWGTRCIFNGDFANRYIGKHQDILLELNQENLNPFHYEIICGSEEDDQQDMLLAICKLKQ